MKEDIIKKLIELQSMYDTEGAHLKADDLLCEFLIKIGHQDIVDEFNKIGKWYG